MLRGEYGQARPVLQKNIDNLEKMGSCWKSYAPSLLRFLSDILDRQEKVIGFRNFWLPVPELVDA